MRALPPKSKRRAAAAALAVRPVRGVVAAPAPREEPGRVSQAVARPTAEALSAIVDPYRDKGWGFRFCACGASGSGKSFFSERLLNYAIGSGAAAFALVYDHKDPTPSFAGTLRVNAADFTAHPPEQGESPIVVFHEDAPGDPDEVAALGMQLGGSGVPTVIDVDELFPDAVTDGGQQFRSGQGGPLGLALRTGRSRGVSVIFGTQLPQFMPTVAMDLCEANGWFRLQGRSLAYVEREGRLPREAIEIVRNLRRGEFVLTIDGAWNGVVYGPE